MRVGRALEGIGLSVLYVLSVIGEGLGGDFPDDTYEGAFDLFRYGGPGIDPRQEADLIRGVERGSYDPSTLRDSE